MDNEGLQVEGIWLFLRKSERRECPKRLRGMGNKKGAVVVAVGGGGVCGGIV